MPKTVDVTGVKFHRLTGVKMIDNKKWEWVCDCGNRVIAAKANVKNSHTKSCGCLKLETIRKHNRCHTPEYDVWANITNRCGNLNHPQFSLYGGRGIKMHQEWRDSFVEFFAYVGERPTAAHTIERLNNDRGYEPGNVEWKLMKDQCRNKRSNHWIEIGGQRLVVEDWARLKGISASTISHRIARGMSEHDAVMTPPREGGRRMSKHATH